ncbi:MAG: sugar ABC transporter substrate-binding protein [Bacteroidetes bacterium]|nr:sugar ABC transporter substrate-binding protein [Bacteroidota bacterium]
MTVAYIGFSTDRPFWVTLGKAIKEEAATWNIDLIDLTPSDPDPKLQSRLLEHAVEKQVNGIIIGAITPSSLYTALSKASQNKIPVIAVDTRIEHQAIVSFIATDNIKGAALAGRYIVDKTKGIGTVLILGGTKNHPNGEARRNGVEKEAKNAGMTVLFRRANWNDELAYKITSDELQKENDIAAIFSCWDPGIDTASHVIEKMKIKNKIVTVGFDGLTRTLEYIRDGKVDATIAQNPTIMGVKSVEILVSILNGDDFLKEILILPYLVDQNHLN